MITERRKLGDLGEQIAVNYFKKQGYRILERNYLKPWGEIDIIVEDKDRVIVFVEVKTGRTGIKPCFSFSPEQNVHWQKQKKLIKTAQTYLLEKNYLPEISWQIDVVAVELNFDNRKAGLRHYKNAVWG